MYIENKFTEMQPQQLKEDLQCGKAACFRPIELYIRTRGCTNATGPQDDKRVISARALNMKYTFDFFFY